MMDSGIPNRSRWRSLTSLDYGPGSPPRSGEIFRRIATIKPPTSRLPMSTSNTTNGFGQNGDGFRSPPLSTLRTAQICKT